MTGGNNVYTTKIKIKINYSIRHICQKKEEEQESWWYWIRASGGNINLDKGKFIAIRAITCDSGFMF